jgi:hypothetical protein
MACQRESPVVGVGAVLKQAKPWRNRLTIDCQGRGPRRSMTIGSPPVLEFEVPNYRVRIYRLDPVTGKAT